MIQLAGVDLDGGASIGRLFLGSSNTRRLCQTQRKVLPRPQVCGVTTDTLVKSKKSDSNTSEAQAGVVIRVMVDGVVAQPGEVTFCSR